MDFQRLNAIAKKTMAGRKAHKERETGFIYTHGQRTAKSVQILRARVTDDASHDELLACAAMFHDVGKGIGEHGQTGAALARVLLKDELAPDALEEVARLIAAHNQRAPETDRWDLWARLLQDADALDHFGAMEIWINFHYCAFVDQTMMDSVKFYQTEFLAESAKIRKLLNFDVSRQIFDEKIAFVIAFARRMEVEGAGGFVV